MDEVYQLEKNQRSIIGLSDDIEKQNERGVKSIVVQLGSRVTTYGIASVQTPERILTCISAKKEGATRFQRDSNDLSTVIKPETLLAIRKTLVDRGVIVDDSKNSQVVEEPLSLTKRDQIDIDLDAEIVIGQIVSLPDYYVRFPLMKGNFSVSNSGTYREDNAISDLIQIIEFIILQKLKIPTMDLKDHDLILVLPDNFDKKTYERFFDFLIKKFQFRGVSLHQESVMAFYGRNCSLGAFVDIGFTKSCLAGVDEGIQIRDSLLVGDLSIKTIRDVWRAILKLKRNLNIDEFDFGGLEDLLWEKCACFSNNPVHVVETEIVKTTPNVKSFRVKLEYFDRPDTFTDIVFYTEDFILALNFIFEKSELNSIPLDKQILDWVQKLPSEANKAKIVSNLVVSGGLSDIPGFAHLLEEHLIELITIENAAFTAAGVCTENKEVGRYECPFVGGCVVPKLDSYIEIVIFTDKYLANTKNDSKDKKSSLGDNYLKERISFQW